MKKITFLTTIILAAITTTAQIINIPADYSTIQEGIDNASNGDTVLVDTGTYIENITLSGKSLTVASLFFTTGDTSYISQTIIDGNQNGSVVSFTGDETWGAVLCGFTILNGSNSGIDIGYSAAPTLKNLIIKDNISEISGGGVSCFEGKLVMKNVIITNNIAPNGVGGGIFAGYCSVTLENVTITKNTATDGGGIYCFYIGSDLSNVVIANNTANNGGGIYLDHTGITLESVTIANNSATNVGGGILCYGAYAYLVNSICWGDSLDEIVFSDEGSSNLIDILYSDIEGGEGGIITNNNGTVNWMDGNIDEDPLFTGSGDFPYSLQNESPCINTGIPDTTGLNLPELDLAGNPRVFGGQIEMGAYENQIIHVAINEFEVQSLKSEVWNYPNPFTTSTTIEYELAQPENVRIIFYNQFGEQVDMIENKQSEGKQQVIWNAEGLPGGIYFCMLKSESEIRTLKMIKIK